MEKCFKNDKKELFEKILSVIKPGQLEMLKIMKKRANQ